MLHATVVSGRRGSNSRPIAWKAIALSTELLPQKYTVQSNSRSHIKARPWNSDGVICGKRWIRTTEGVRQQIYSLPHLATLVSSQYLTVGLSLISKEPMEGFEPTTPRLQISCSGQLSYIGVSLNGCKGKNFFLICKLFANFFQKKIHFYSFKELFATLLQGFGAKSCANIQLIC